MKNESGLKPVGAAVLVLPYEIEKVSKGGIVLTHATRERDMMAEQRAILVEAGPEAWKGEAQPRALPGQKVLYAKYSGYAAKGTADGKQYRVVNDADIFLRIVEEKELES